MIYWIPYNFLQVICALSAKKSLRTKSLSIPQSLQPYKGLSGPPSRSITWNLHILTFQCVTQPYLSLLMECQSTHPSYPAVTGWACSVPRELLQVLRSLATELRPQPASQDCWVPHTVGVYTKGLSPSCGKSHNYHFHTPPSKCFWYCRVKHHLIKSKIGLFENSS